MLRRRLLQRLARGAMRAVARVEVRGTPPSMEAPCLIAVNHLSQWEPPFLLALLPRPPEVAALATLRQEWAAPFFHLYDAIPVYRDQFDRSIIERLLAVLERGHSLAIAPEGRISRTGALERARSGVGHLALMAQVPIYPVAFTGTETIDATLRRGRRARVTASFGPPLPPDRFSELPRRQQRQALTDATMRAIAALLPPAYRGVYADEPALEGEAAR